MELFTIDTILPAASGILFITQAIYHLGLYNKLYIHNKETVYTTDVNAENPPLSVIIVAKDAADELQENLPFILEQDYPEFEVIVIYDRSADDCDDTLKLLEDKYPNLYHTFIPDSARYISHKKLGITMGIKASRHEWLVFTEPNCRPQSNQWLKQMARNFTPATEIVLGYSNYEKVPGWLNKKTHFRHVAELYALFRYGPIRTSLYGYRTEPGLSENTVLQTKGFSLPSESATRRG